MNLITSVDLNWGIGYKGKLLEHISEDMKFFKDKTTQKVVIMGKNTFESLPNKKPLKNRKNVVLTTDNLYFYEGITVCNSLGDLLDVIHKYDSENIYVIGGQLVFLELLEFCKTAYITKIFKSYKCDRYMINLDNCKSWEQVESSEIKIKNDIEYCFIRYENKDLKKLI
jgi:dihydrofolate reductase